ncbi:MAG: hypothetical protein QOI08_3727, partial [Actinomycetota bacterium]|nr:hypothetical protein [Actinomycetota bacterium]
MSHVAFPIALAVALALFGMTIARRTRVLLRAKPAALLGDVPARIRKTAVYAFGQAKF